MAGRYGANDGLDGALRLVHDNPNMGCRPVTSTRDVNTVAAAGQLAPTIAAGVSTEATPPCIADPVEAATVWKNGVPVGVDLLSLPGTPRREARGVSDSGAVVGGSISSTSALYWHTTPVAPLDIGSLVTGGSIAQRINNNNPPSVADPLQVAGWHVPVFSPEAVLWECSGSCDVLEHSNSMRSAFGAC